MTFYQYCDMNFHLNYCWATLHGEISSLTSGLMILLTSALVPGLVPPGVIIIITAGTFILIDIDLPFYKVY